MSPKIHSVRALAMESGLDSEEVLLALWNAGYEDVVDVDDQLTAQQIGEVKKSLGIADPRQMTRLKYWQEIWELSETETRERLKHGYGIHVVANARTLPKGSLRRIVKVIDLPVAVPEKEDVATDEPEFNWRCRGHKGPIEYLTEQEVLDVHDALVRDFAHTMERIDPPGPRDHHLVGSAVFRPQTSLSGEPKYETVESATAALMHSLVHDHAFWNGNKRVALVSMLVMLDRNGLLLTCSEKELFRYVLRVAQHRLVPRDWGLRDDREVMEICDWICSNSRLIEKGERLIKWHELRRILTGFGCEIGNPLPGNRIKVCREVSTKGFFGLPRKKMLAATLGRRSEGHEVDQSTLKYIRKTLELDEDHNVDSAIFYGKEQKSPDDFISEYRTLLRRLGKI